MGFIGKAWRGEERLWRVFWLYGVLLGFGIGIVLGILQLILGDAMAIPSAIFQLIFTLWITVSEWRCAFNVNWRGWGYIIRSLIVVSILLLVLGLLFGATLVGQDLIKAAECRRDLKARIDAGENVNPEQFKAECLQRQGLLVPTQP